MILKNFKNKKRNNTNDTQVIVFKREDFLKAQNINVEPEEKHKEIITFDDLVDDDIEILNDPENYREFKTIDEAEQWGRSLYDSWGKKVKDFEREKKLSGLFEDGSWAYTPIEYYCGWDYQKINTYYRTGNEMIEDKCKYRAVRMSEELLQAPRIPENIVVYRYVNEECINELLRATKFNESKQFCEKGFMSTSLVKEIAKDAPDNSVLLKLYVSKATVGAYVNSVVRRNEYEMLLQNKLFLRICKKPYWDEEYGMMMIECKTTSFVM
ncbi:MAG: ADP-ribosyltransferase [Eubacterium sp.]|jgi:hypothetical protein|uniref:ADP-ribosyltransferase n=1 Tax=Eubacterium sp. TaxID=142586 RepID=UPI003990ED8A